MTVGVVVPTLGEPARLGLLTEALASIRSQGGVDVQVVLVTTESRVGVLRALLPDITVVSQQGKGIADAIMCGWAALAADADYVAWLGDDDRLTPGALAAATDALESEPMAGLVFGRCRYIGMAGEQLCETRPGRAALTLLSLGTNLIAQPGSLYRRTAVDAMGGLDCDLALAFDVDLHLRLSRATPAVYLPRVLGEARVHPGSLTTSERGRSEAEAEWVMSRGLGTAMAATRVFWRPPVRFAGRIVSKLGTRTAMSHPVDARATDGRTARQPGASAR